MVRDLVRAVVRVGEPRSCPGDAAAALAARGQAASPGVGPRLVGAPLERVEQPPRAYPFADDEGSVFDGRYRA
ncbi:MAG: hypothetical protein CSA66_05775 [Proteobacteria bacterium]|nr:MAG: hypothetical protein CSA66_05775 [Pseudomonadota bacterium]